ncbi:MAG: hypothetical protein A3G02_00200 [Candidatus Yanofskybacteria bacterium RIFCSPLOWO2_12_FULL_44_13b]|uniref:DUF378 domain-containing protein n=1 Tax=Candidatus Yanofskybacteria bacterium RIFCSPLOWO2_02_FULL_44_18 TaxID=1802705 RepID=A0A1F8H199_9BACT|nr:MAG: hypothetical protein A2657_01045 [Candidatus Yanofskybacteria bacterium RIFCSPHIGHO2_01_FULL_44_110b]OGN15196.1 MAG: hypothetical protein A3C01_01870 [Candidatus Yanofskybacteria bacterium RIFCSPHIGHO2_02_FULL_44_36b]OGN18473.1 MAG: hypothetical protein A3F50_01460 [Candidatus Yanofskybacteria bacterium RIFCSPHIGHO2_12_FULL_44_29b]OGN26623.1 MAG: hypothetical protein A3B12_01200 [Candidatus Yanofskybacteria bacterium RIFCSPLOWO2_01_FULL_44_88]OGN31301.1 MAG: hypothetical protein A3I96_0
MKGLHSVAWWLMVIGSLNWLLIGLFNINVITRYLPSLATVAYILIGLSAVYALVGGKRASA